MILNVNNDIVLEDNRVRLEALQPMHFAFLLPIALKQPNLLQYSPSPFGSKTGLNNYISKAIAARKEGVRYAFAIFDKPNGTYVGSTSFGNILNKNQHVEIGWTWISKAFQGTGLNKHCKFLMLQYVFDILEFERVTFKSDSRNKQSRRAIEKIGATYEGCLRSHVLMNDGYRRDSVYYSILKAEWSGIKETIFAGF